jgi:mRNA degradation ribonuclease J1/J2
MAAEKLRILPLGGLGEIGKNMTVLEYEGRILIVDCGVRFPTAEMVGIDLVLPDFSCLRGRIDDIEGIVITHGHEDHLGGLPWMLREIGEGGEMPPVFGAPLTMAMARSKLDEHKLREVEVEDVEPGELLELGPFDVLDRNGDASVCADELREGIAQATRAPAQPVLVEGLLRALDTDGDGVISRDEAAAAREPSREGV